MISIKEVISAKDIREFVDFQFDLYKKDLEKCKSIDCLKKTFIKVNKSLITYNKYIELWKIKDELKNKLW